MIERVLENEPELFSYQAWMFTLATNAVFYRFWEFSEPIASLEVSLFFKNVAIAGALIFVAATEDERARTTKDHTSKPPNEDSA